ncbi:hypothetical protein H5203_21495 [Pseudoalteromonas sp. SG41-1]|uniref:hypothetical protein n=1 Tax=Pseudoalteromonas sp. SG41-1 TaxID=2760979 RepID=UPI001600302B|nr:hypothetical protein [Pseudoalteromonas sp. SG41-1]MBB1508021.1 hypothetical protein [Pseudoalteromonas sp. SG41-1]
MNLQTATINNVFKALDTLTGAEYNVLSFLINESEDLNSDSFKLDINKLANHISSYNYSTTLKNLHKKGFINLRKFNANREKNIEIRKKSIQKHVPLPIKKVFYYKVTLNI